VDHGDRTFFWPITCQTGGGSEAQGWCDHKERVCRDVSDHSKPPVCLVHPSSEGEDWKGQSWAETRNTLRQK
jgi:hypothetical protein